MKIFMMGDSTMRYNNFQRYPQCGWGQVLHMFTKNQWLVEDHAENGRSTKSFKDEGRFDVILSRLEKGDFVICQFGHNDQKDDPKRYTEAYGSYQDNLKYFALEVEKKGGRIVFATSVTRHQFVDGKVSNTHFDYPQAMIDFCNANGYTCIDLNGLTINLYNKIGEEASSKFHMIFPPNIYPNYLEGKEDHTHLVYRGALMVAELFVRAIAKTNDPIKECFINLEEKEEIDYTMLID